VRAVALSGGNAAFDPLQVAARFGADATLGKPFTRGDVLAALGGPATRPAAAP
jgi:hypothetical protein